jgi:rubrerythrin
MLSRYRAASHVRRVTAYAESPEATEAFRREHPPPPEDRAEDAYYRSSSEDDDCKHPDPMRERAPDDGDDKEAWLQRQEARREQLAREATTGATSARYAGEHVPVYARLAEIKETVERRLHETAGASPWFGSGVHWLCKLCGHYHRAMRGKNWVDEDDPDDERVYGLGHGWCQD